MCPRCEWSSHLGSGLSYPSHPADTTWIRAQPPSQALPELLVHKTVSKITWFFSSLSFGVLDNQHNLTIMTISLAFNWIKGVKFGLCLELLFSLYQITLDQGKVRTYYKMQNENKSCYYKIIMNASDFAQKKIALRADGEGSRTEWYECTRTRIWCLSIPQAVILLKLERAWGLLQEQGVKKEDGGCEGQYVISASTKATAYSYDHIFLVRGREYITINTIKATMYGCSRLTGWKWNQ